MTYPEGSLSVIGFIVLFFFLYSLVQLGRGLIAGLTERPELQHQKIHWFSIFTGLFIIYLIINWNDIAANTWRGYQAGMQNDLNLIRKLTQDSRK